MNIGNKIKALRLKASTTQETMAEALGVSSQAISKWENNICAPDISLLPAISEFLGVTIDELFDLSVEQKLHRIENMLDYENELTDEQFRNTEEFLLEIKDTYDDTSTGKMRGRIYTFLGHLYAHRMASDSRYVSMYARKAMRMHPGAKEDQWLLQKSEGAYICDWNIRQHNSTIEFFKELVKMNPEIYGVYAKALNGAKKHQEAIDVYKKTLELEFDSQDKKAGVIKDLADAYKGIDDYENAVTYYDLFLKTVSHASLTDYADLGRLYVQYADKLEGDAKIEKLTKADQIYSDLAEKNADAKEYSLFWRARVNQMMDPEAKDGKAQPFYEELFNAIMEKAEKDKADMARVKEAGQYLMVYYLKIKDDTQRSIEFAEKLLTVDPANETATQIVSMKK